jgi:hypothetical protein
MRLLPALYIARNLNQYGGHLGRTQDYQGIELQVAEQRAKHLSKDQKAYFNHCRHPPFLKCPEGLAWASLPKHWHT